MRTGRRGMGRLKGIRRVRQDGKVYRYHRATGIRLPDDIDEHAPDFINAWLAAEKLDGVKPEAKRKAKEGTLAHLWQIYAQSGDYLSLSEGYRAVVRRIADSICERGGTVPVKQIQPRHIRTDLRQLSPNPARQRLKVWRMLFSFAVSRGWVEENPAKTVEQVKSPKPAKHKKWETDQIEDFRTRWPIGTAQRMAFELMLFVGCRVSDLVRLGPGMVNADGWLVFRQQKTGGKVAIPLYGPLPGFADADTQRSLHIALTEPTIKHLACHRAWKNPLPESSIKLVQ